MIEAIRVEHAVPAQISKIQAKKQNIFTTENYSDISKKYSTAKSSQEIALLNLDKKTYLNVEVNKKALIKIILNGRELYECVAKKCNLLLQNKS